MIGRVYFVGAGPGDPDLITVRGLCLLKQADVLLHDSLIHPQRRLDVSASCEVVDVGKRKGAHSKKQQDIHALLIRYAKAGKRVVRLQGGDPATFGRLGEELSALEAEGIAYEIVPGVSSVQAVPAYAGIPITHRPLARSFGVVTGTITEGDMVDDQAIPKADTLIVLMGLSVLDRLVDRLIQLGRPKQQPIAVISCGTRAEQQVVTGTLGTICDQLASTKMATPAMIVVGEVVGTRAAPSWAEKRPLFGKRVFVFRPSGEGGALVEGLRSLGADVIHEPALERLPIANSFPGEATIEAAQTIVFTSSFGVQMAFQMALDSGHDARLFHGKRVVAIGPRTAQALRSYGLLADVVSSGGSEALISANEVAFSKTSTLFVVGDNSKGMLQSWVRSEGGRVLEWIAYTAQYQFRQPVSLRSDDSIVLTSARLAAAFLEQVYRGERITVYCFGTDAEALLKSHSTIRVRRIETYRDEAIMAAILWDGS